MIDTTKQKRTLQSDRTPNADPQRGGDESSPQEQSTASELPSNPAGKTDTKAARIVALMQRAEGATLDEMVAATNWLPHTTRAAMTGLKRKGQTITSIKADGVRRYFAVAAQ